MDMGSGDENSIETAEVAAAARRERLRAFKAAQEQLDLTKENGDDNLEDKEETSVSLKFRNYVPNDKKLQEGKLAPPVLPKFEDPVLEASLPEEKKEDPFLHIAPKKPNWDLKKDLQKRLDKLERRTQKAMLILMEREEAERASVVEAENEGDG